MSKTYRMLAAGAAVALASFAAGAADKYPFDPVSMVVPYPAGGVGDTTGRIFSDAMGKPLDTHVLVENVGGAAGAIGAAKVLNAKADGSIFFQGSQNELILAPMINNAIRYKATDFQAVQPVTVTPLVLMTRADLPANNVAEFVELAKQRGEAHSLTYGTTGVGSLYHLVTARVGKAAGVPLTHVPYKGGAPIIQDLIGGQIDFTIIAYQTSMKDLADQGRVKILAIFSKDNKPKSLANMPSISDTPVFRDFDYASYVGYYVKKGTSPEVAQQLNTALGKALQDPGVIQKIEADGRSVLKPGSLADAEAFYDREIKKYAEIVKTLDLKFE